MCPRCQHTEPSQGKDWGVKFEICKPCILKQRIHDSISKNRDDRL
jgi:hypothetical protein